MNKIEIYEANETIVTECSWILYTMHSLFVFTAIDGTIWAAMYDINVAIMMKQNEWEWRTKKNALKHRITIYSIDVALFLPTSSSCIPANTFLNFIIIIPGIINIQFTIVRRSNHPIFCISLYTIFYGENTKNNKHGTIFSEI